MTIDNNSSCPSQQSVRIVVLPGDNIGPEVTAEALRILKNVTDTRASYYGFHSVEYVEALIGGCAIDKCKSPLPEETIALINHPDTKALLLGAIGGPQWPSSCPHGRPEQGLLELRKQLNCYANVRPCQFPSKSLVSCSPLKAELVDGVDIIVVRELCGGIYFGEREEADQTLTPDTFAFDKCCYSVREIQDITRVACRVAIDQARSKNWPRPRITSVDKANVLASSRLWRRVVETVVSNEYPDIDLSHEYVDAAAMHLIKHPKMLNGVVLTSNLFGDILSDESSVIVGSLGLLPSASLTLDCLLDNVHSRPALYEPIHGSAPDIAGKNIANPVGAILSAAMLLRYSLGMRIEAEIIEKAVEKVLEMHRTADLGGNTSTDQFGQKTLNEVMISLQQLK